MPSTSPGPRTSQAPNAFTQILPGSPTVSLQSLTSFIFRHKRYIAYISGHQLNLLSSPTVLIQSITFKEGLVAISAQESTGKLAVACGDAAFILEPVVQGWTKVWWEKTLCLRRGDPQDEARCLSWGNEGEVLIGGTRQLSLFSTRASSRTPSPAVSPVGEEDAVEERRPLWTKSVPSPLRSVAFNSTAGLIATCGMYDKLVKIWRRLSFEEGLFDYTYLAHPGMVTYMEWRPPSDHTSGRRGSGLSRRQDEDPEVLFTAASDGVLRIWHTGGPHDLDILALYTTVDLVGAVPHSPTLTTAGSKSAPKPSRYVFILPSDRFCAAVTATLADRVNGSISLALELLKEMSSKSPDVIVTLDGQGRMSAWGIESVGHKRRPDTPGANQAFHVTNAERMSSEVLGDGPATFLPWFDGSSFHVLMQVFGKDLTWWQGNVEDFFAPSTSDAERLTEVAAWSSGHDDHIDGLRGLDGGSGLVSWSDAGRLTLWTAMSETQKLQMTSSFTTITAVHDSLPLRAHDLVAVTGSKSMVLFTSEGKRQLEATHNVGQGADSGTVRLYELPIAEDASTIDPSRLLVLSDQTGDGAVVDVRMPVAKDNFDITYFKQPRGDNNAEILHSTRLDSHRKHGGVQILSVDANGILSKTPLKSLLHTRATESNHQAIQPPGRAVSNGPSRSLSQLRQQFRTGMQTPSLMAAKHDFAALASSDRMEVLVVDLAHGYVEHRQPVENKVNQLRFSAATAAQNLLAVGYNTSVDVFAQGRYEHHFDPPAWIHVKQVSCAGIGLQINALEWMQDGTLVLAAGNGLFVASRSYDPNELEREVQDANDIGGGQSGKMDISQVARVIEQPLPVWHPSMLSHLIRHGEAGKASILLGKLQNKLKFWSEGEELHPVLDASIRQLTAPTDPQDASITDDLAKDLLEQLEEKDLPSVSQSEQQRLKRVLKALVYCSEHVKGLDNCALRYLYSWKLQLVEADAANVQQKEDAKANGASTSSITAPAIASQMHWREIAFAHHSATQQPLLDVLTQHYHNKLTWPVARDLGVAAWLSDSEALETVFENLAQSAYRQSSPPDPINASLFFLALHKKPTLLGLWRIATWHREQHATMNFLKRDFSQPEAKTAAKKNAYALMGRRRFQYAAAFFLLADDCASATSVLASQCEDPLLAVAVARLYSGDHSPVLRNLIENKILPQARQQGNRWLISWCHSVLGQVQRAALALVEPLGGVRTWHQDDPSTLMLYRHMRQRGVTVDAGLEYQAVLRSAGILRRQGLWLVALELVRNWEFTPTPPRTTETLVEDEAVATQFGDSMKLDQATQVAADDKASREAKATEMLKRLHAKKPANFNVLDEKKPAATQFQEPEANSLLDSFGF